MPRVNDEYIPSPIEALCTENRKLLQQRDELENEMQEQARIIGMGAERELALIAKVESLEKENASLKQDAERYRKQKEFPQIKMDTFEGKYRSHNGFSIFSDWCETYDEAFDFAVAAMQGA